MLLPVQHLEHCGLIQGWKRQVHDETFVNAHANQECHNSVIFNINSQHFHSMISYKTLSVNLHSQ